MMCACRRIPPTGIDAECLVPPWGSLPNHTFGVRRLPIPSRADLFEWFKGIFHWKVISIRHRQCALQFQEHFVLWCCFFPSCGNNPAVKYSCRCMDKCVLESLTVSLFWPKIQVLYCEGFIHTVKLWDCFLALPLSLCANRGQFGEYDATR